MLVNLLFLKLCSGFHFYINAAESKCLTEVLYEEQLVEATYKVLIYNAQSNTYLEQADATMKVSVYSFVENGNLLDTTLSYKGKFKFTANDNGRYKICMTPMTKGWFNTKAKVFYEQRTGTHHENDDVGDPHHENGIESILHDRVKDIRGNLNLLTMSENELRELSEKINTDTYRYTLLLIAVIIAVAFFQLKALERFFVAKKVV